MSKTRKKFRDEREVRADQRAARHQKQKQLMKAQQRDERAAWRGVGDHYGLAMGNY